MSKKKKVILISGIAAVCVLLLCVSTFFVSAVGELDGDTVYEGCRFHKARFQRKARPRRNHCHQGKNHDTRTSDGGNLL